MKTFGILDDAAARQNWEWKGAQFDLQRTIDDFSDEVTKYPDRIKAIELYSRPSCLSERVWRRQT